MKKSYLLFMGLVVLVVAGAVFLQSASFGDPEVKEGLGLQAIVYKTPTCGCCHVFSQYLESEGVSVEVKDLANLSPTKKQYGIPQELESCHTTVIGDYVIEGHIPLEVINKLVTEKPDIKGIALPGMPSGSPGMPGPKIGQWTIYALNNDGRVTEYMQY